MKTNATSNGTMAAQHDVRFGSANVAVDLMKTSTMLLA
jgi:hypothetical protein